MEKTIKIADQEVKLNNNVGWTFIYRDQFGHDIIPSLMPMLSSIATLVGGLIEETGKTEFEAKDLAKITNSDAFAEAVFKLGTLELTDFINITWALAKCADDTIEEPRLWVRQFDTFPLDEVLPEIFDLVTSGVVSTKNLSRLQGMTKTLKPTTSTSTKSSSPQSKED